MFMKPNKHIYLIHIIYISKSMIKAILNHEIKGKKDQF